MEGYGYTSKEWKFFEVGKLALPLWVRSLRFFT